jgi:uncharacterized membrane protein
MRTSSSQALAKSFWWAAASLVPMVVGAFGPWAKVADLLTINGTDGERDGWFVVGAAGTAAVALLAYSRFGRGWLLALPLLAGLAAVATTAYDLNDLGDTEPAVALLGLAVSAGWGIYVALVASISLVLASLALVIEIRFKKASRVPLETPSGA